ncbi:MAG: hypothetical protein PHY64_00885 [Eubacteriales bacterium]|nr:hypothetical protein [Eubacteriales bacterium]
MSKAMLVLERCLAAESEISELKARYEWQLDAATAVSQKLEPAGDRHAAGTNSEAVATNACELAELRDAVCERERRRSAEVIGVTRMLKRLSMNHARLIQLCYVKRLPLGAVAKKMGYSYGYIRVLKGEALARVAEISDGEVAAVMPDWYPWSLTSQELAASNG